MSTSAIVPVSQLTDTKTGLLAPIEGFEGMTLKPSQIRLIQNSTAGVGETVMPGKLVDMSSNQHFNEMKVVFLKVNRGRVFFPPDQVSGGTPICRSNDNAYPAPNVKEKQSPMCATCDHGPKLWRTYRTTGVKPDCDETVNILMLERTTGFPYYLSVRGANIKSFNDIYGAIHKSILMKRSKGENINLWDYTIDVKPMRISGKNGNYYVLNFINLQQIANIGEYGPLYEMFVTQQKQVENDRAVDEAVDAEYEDVPTVYQEA